MGKVPQTPSTTLLGPLEEGIQVEEGEILEEEEVILGETLEEAGEILPHHTTNFQGNNPLSLTEIAGSPRRSYKNGISTGGSIVLPPKS